MVHKEIEKLHTCDLSLQRWEVLGHIAEMGAKSNENFENLGYENRGHFVLYLMLISMTEWATDMPEQPFHDVSQTLTEEFYEN